MSRRVGKIEKLSNCGGCFLALESKIIKQLITSRYVINRHAIRLSLQLHGADERFQRPWGKRKVRGPPRAKRERKFENL